MREVGNLKRIGEQFSAQDSGTLSIATTHTQARYVLPVPVAKLREAYPKVNVSLHQGSPDQVARMVIDEIAEIGIATESLSDYPDLVTLPCYEWQHVLVLPQDHPLAKKERITLEDIAASRSSPTTRRSPAARASTRLRAEEADAAHRAGSDRFRRDQDLRAPGPGHRHRGRDGGARRRQQRRPRGAPAGHLVRPEPARVAFKRGAYLRNFVFKFAELLSDRLDRNLIAKAMSGHQRLRTLTLSFPPHARTHPAPRHQAARHVGTTIFTVMSALAAEKNAVNLGQGFPDFELRSEAVEAVTAAMARA
jgi:LysR family cys regulon transcriptional activator